MATQSRYRVWARELIEKVISDHVVGSVESLPPADLRELRGILRTACGFGGLSRWEKQILSEEWRLRFGYPVKTRPKMRRVREIAERDVLPSMREWARKHGVIPAEAPTVTNP